MRRLIYSFPIISVIACAASVGLCGPVSAQYRRTELPYAQEACPQGREIRAYKAYPSTMTDCEVLDADTAFENQRLRKPIAAPKPAVSVEARAPEHVYSTRQIEAIRMTTFSALAGEYCQEVIENGGAGRELIDAGIQVSDFGSAEYERIRQDARAFLAGINPAARCGELWRVLGPGGSYGRQLVRSRLASDPPYRWNPLRQD
jgi:hypothetical protein